MAQREKLMQALFANAISIGVLKVEQERIGSELDEIQRQFEASAVTYAQVAASLSKCLDLIQNCWRLYMESKPAHRRMLNQAIFEGLYVLPDNNVRAELAAPFKILNNGEFHKLAREGRRQPLKGHTTIYERRSAKILRDLKIEPPGRIFLR